MQLPETSSHCFSAVIRKRTFLLEKREYGMPLDEMECT
jgi:hypothetical protein